MRAKKRNEGGGGRERTKTLARKPHDFEKLHLPTNAAFDWCGTGSVDYLALGTSIKPGMFCLRLSQTWSDLICGRRLQMLWSENLFESCLCEVSSIKSIILLEIKQWRLVKANLLGMTGCVSDWKKWTVC